MDACDFCNNPTRAIEAVVERQTVGTVPPSMTRLTIVLIRCVPLLNKPPDASEVGLSSSLRLEVRLTERELTVWWADRPIAIAKLTGYWRGPIPLHWTRQQRDDSILPIISSKCAQASHFSLR